MTSLQECNARAQLCREFARLELNSKNIWLAEAERWSRLTREPDVVAGRYVEPAETGLGDIWKNRRLI
jgi:hypothetical protein